jgi:hypothetical protein
MLELQEVYQDSSKHVHSLPGQASGFFSFNCEIRSQNCRWNDSAGFSCVSAPRLNLAILDPYLPFSHTDTAHSGTAMNERGKRWQNLP